MYERVADLREGLRLERAAGKRIGLVPTMGFLHRGHMSLIERARGLVDLVVVSIFVNPTQFGPGEDYERYPRDLEGDREKAASAGAGVLFVPRVEEMYPEGATTWVDVGPMGQVLCGASRPGHFRGVAMVVTKLFNIVQPDVAVFGQKDGQQAAIIQKLVRDLHLPVEIIVAPTLREEDGLALSSRNVYLRGEERTAALALHRALERARGLLVSGKKDSRLICREMEAVLAREPLVRLDYAAVVDAATLDPIDVVAGRVLVAVAAFVGKTRLIDNLVFEA